MGLSFCWRSTTLLFLTLKKVQAQTDVPGVLRVQTPDAIAMMISPLGPLQPSYWRISGSCPHYSLLLSPHSFSPCPPLLYRLAMAINCSIPFSLSLSRITAVNPAALPSPYTP